MCTRQRPTDAQPMARSYVRLPMMSLTPLCSEWASYVGGAVQGHEPVEEVKSLG